MGREQHITPAVFWEMLGDAPAADPSLRQVLLHLLESCPECHSAWRDFPREVIERESDCGRRFARTRERVQREQEQYAEEKETARRLCDELLGLPREGQQARVKRTRRRLASRPVITELLARCIEVGFRDPNESERLAELARELTFRLREDGPSFHDLQALIAAHKGNARRIACDHAAAEQYFTNADAHLEQGTGDVLVEAQIASLRASLWNDLCRRPQALEELEQVEYIFRALGNRLSLCRVLLNKAQVLRASGRPTAAIAITEPVRDELKGLNQARLLLAAHVNLALYYGDLGRFQDAQELLDASTHLAQQFRRSSMWTNRLWAQGNVCAGLNQGRAAEACYQRARSDFLAAGNTYDYALCSLDLAALAAESGQLGKVQEIAEEVLPILQAFDLKEAAAAALLLFLQAARDQRATLQIIQAAGARLRELPRPALQARRP